MRTLAETAAHSRGKSDTGLSELVSQLVRRGESVLPALLAVPVQQIHLRGLRTEGRHLHPQQPDLISSLPITSEQSPDLLENFSIELGGAGPTVSAGNGCEILIAELELHRPGVEVGFPQTPSDHLRQSH